MRFPENMPEFVTVALPGCICVVFGPTGVGKTVSALKTLKPPIFVINTEPRDLMRALIASEINFKLINPKHAVAAEGDLCYCDFTNWDSARHFMTSFDFSNYCSILLDGGTELSKHSANAVLDNKVNELTDEKRENISIMDESTLDWPAYYRLANQMDRMISPLTRWAQRGKFIVFNVLLADEKNEWKQSFEGKPMFVGGKFGKELPGKVDLIGMATRRYKKILELDDDGNPKLDENNKPKVKLDENNKPKTKLVYPPWIQFEPRDGQKFECKWTGKKIVFPNNKNLPEDERVMEGPLDFGYWFEFKKYNPETNEWIYQEGYENYKPVPKKESKETITRKGE